MGSGPRSSTVLEAKAALARDLDFENLRFVIEAHQHLVAELIKAMPTMRNSNYAHCRWCHADLFLTGERGWSERINGQGHAPDCFAVKYLGRPSR